MSRTVIHPDLVMWACEYLRRFYLGRPEEYCQQVAYVGAFEPEQPPEGNDFHVVVRLDGSNREEIVNRDSSLGVTVIGRDLRDPAPAMKLSELTQVAFKIAPYSDFPGPVVAVPDDGLLGPYLVTGDNERARAYQTLGVVSSGEPFI